jgi:hypothetical protein
MMEVHADRAFATGRVSALVFNPRKQERVTFARSRAFWRAGQPGKDAE